MKAKGLYPVLLVLGLGVAAPTMADGPRGDRHGYSDRGQHYRGGYHGGYRGHSGNHYRSHHHRHSGSNTDWNIWLGAAPLGWAPAWSPAPYAWGPSWGYRYPPATVVIQQPAPTVYVERPVVVPAVPAVPAPATAATLWFYCEEPAGYYPHVQHCSRSWISVDPAAVTGSPVR